MESTRKYEKGSDVWGNKERLDKEIRWMEWIRRERWCSEISWPRQMDGNCVDRRFVELFNARLVYCRTLVLCLAVWKNAIEIQIFVVWHIGVILIASCTSRFRMATDLQVITFLINCSFLTEILAEKCCYDDNRSSRPELSHTALSSGMTAETKSGPLLAK